MVTIAVLIILFFILLAILFYLYKIKERLDVLFGLLIIQDQEAQKNDLFTTDLN